MINIIYKILFFFSFIQFFNSNAQVDPLDPEPIENLPQKDIANICKGIPFEKVLDNYKVGEFHINNKENTFCGEIVNYTNSIKTNNNIECIIITGYADGHKNDGLPIDKTQIPPKCKSLIADKNNIKDSTLAKMRACVIYSILQDLFDESYAISFEWNYNKFVDIKDDGDTTGSSRKVVVHVYKQQK